MQGEHPLPYPVIEKFASGQGEISKNVFLLSARVFVALRVPVLIQIHQANQGLLPHRMV